MALPEPPRGLKDTGRLIQMAKALGAKVIVTAGSQELVLTVSDDGSGLPDAPSESGLRNARRRADAAVAGAGQEIERRRLGRRRRGEEGQGGAVDGGVDRGVDVQHGREIGQRQKVFGDGAHRSQRIGIASSGEASRRLM